MHWAYLFGTDRFYKFWIEMFIWKHIWNQTNDSWSVQFFKHCPYLRDLGRGGRLRASSPARAPKPKKNKKTHTKKTKKQQRKTTHKHPRKLKIQFFSFLGLLFFFAFFVLCCVFNFFGLAPGREPQSPGPGREAQSQLPSPGLRLWGFGPGANTQIENQLPPRPRALRLWARCYPPNKK